MSDKEYERLGRLISGDVEAARTLLSEAQKTGDTANIMRCALVLASQQILENPVLQALINERVPHLVPRFFLGDVEQPVLGEKIVVDLAKFISTLLSHGKFFRVQTTYQQVRQFAQNILDKQTMPRSDLFSFWDQDSDFVHKTGDFNGDFVLFRSKDVRRTPFYYCENEPEFLCGQGWRRAKYWEAVAFAERFSDLLWNLLECNIFGERRIFRRFKLSLVATGSVCVFETTSSVDRYRYPTIDFRVVTGEEQKLIEFGSVVCDYEKNFDRGDYILFVKIPKEEKEK